MTTLATMLEHNARCYAQGEAFVCGDQRQTWEAYVTRALRLGSALAAQGLRRQDRAAILSMNCLPYYELYAANAIAGFITATVNFRLSQAEIAYILRDAAPRVLFFESGFTDTVAALRQELGDITLYICLNAPCPDWATDYEDFLNSGNARGPGSRATPTDAPYLLYTSGTTGRPKGVIHTHEAVCAATAMTALASQFSATSRVLQTSPAFHSGGIIYVNCASWTGGTSVIHREFAPDAVLKTIAEERITHTFMVPAMLQTVLDSPLINGCDVASIEVIHSAAAPIPVPLLKKAIATFGQVFALQYGSTETFSVCSMPPSAVSATGSAQTVGRLASVGQPIAGVAVVIVDDNGQPCASGTPGEVCVRSPSNLSAYWNNHGASLDAFTNGAFRTGDIGYLDNDNYLFLVDRKKDMIISGGENVYSREVENALLAHPQVIDAAVIGVPDEKWGEAVHAIVVLSDVGVDESALIAHCKNLIARYKCPKTIAVVDALPRQGTGKIDKIALRKQVFTPP